LPRRRRLRAPRPTRGAIVSHRSTSVINRVRSRPSSSHPRNWPLSDATDRHFVFSHLRDRLSRWLAQRPSAWAFFVELPTSQRADPASRDKSRCVVRNSGQRFCFSVFIRQGAN
jgi:hypothetical protein